MVSGIPAGGDLPILPAACLKIQMAFRGTMADRGVGAGVCMPENRMVRRK